MLLNLRLAFKDFDEKKMFEKIMWHFGVDFLSKPQTIEYSLIWPEISKKSISKEGTGNKPSPPCHNQKTTKKLLKNCFNGGSYEIFLERLKKQHKTLQNELYTLTSYQNWKDVNFRKKNTYHSILIYIIYLGPIHLPHLWIRKWH